MKEIGVYTPINPTRPFYEKLGTIHRMNVLSMNNRDLFDYTEEHVLLTPNLQKEGLWRGQNVVHHFNLYYARVKDRYKYICKWDDDIVLPWGILQKCYHILEENKVVGVGLFQEDYGAPSILMESPRENGWYGAFSRFYIYRMDRWGEIPVECPWLHGADPTTVRGEHSGDPDNAYQIALKGEKKVLDVPSIHLDHRAYSPERKYAEYNVMLDMVLFHLIR